MTYKSAQQFDIKKGRPDTWRRILAENIPRLYQMFIKRWPNPSLAEELVQKTIFDAVRAKETFDPEKGTLQQWLNAIAKNNLALEMRKRANRPHLDGNIAAYIEAMDSEPLPDEMLERKETAQIVRAAMESIESKQRCVLTAKYIDDLSARDIGVRMKMTEKAVHSLLYRARNSLREKLKQIGPLYSEEQIS